MVKQGISTGSSGGAGEVFTWEYSSGMIKVWTIQEVKNPDSEMLEQHIEDCNLLLWEYIKDNKLFGLTMEDYKKMQNIISDIIYCLIKLWKI